MPEDAEPQRVGHLGPHALGRRVVVRRIVPGVTGPSGGPAFTDVLGVLERWDTSPEGLAVVRREDGEAVTFPVHLVVSGKPVPPRASRFSRLSPERVLRLAEGGFRRLESRHLGDWELRYVGGANPRANSALATGDPGVPVDAALEEVRAFYAAHERPAVAEVVLGSTLDEQLTTRGWTPVSPVATDVLVGGVAALARAQADIDTSAVLLETSLSRDWLVGNDRALANYDVVASTLDLRDMVFASLVVDGRQAARIRANLVEDWAYLADLLVQPEQRGQGLARLMMAAAVEWAAERGATAIVLDASADNELAQRLYADLGLERHHSMRCLLAP